MQATFVTAKEYLLLATKLGRGGWRGVCVCVCVCVKLAVFPLSGEGE